MSNSKNTSSKNTEKNAVKDYKYNPRVENPNPKAATTNKVNNQGSK